MRPDKKKIRHHDSRKREAAAKGKLAVGDKKECFKKKGGEGEGADRSQLPSNWSKYDLPSSDSESNDDDGATGQDFNYVLQNASER